jgi:FixJ family two-component response regulator
VKTAVIAMKAGAADFNVKPVDPEVIIASIEAVLSKEPQVEVAQPHRHLGKFLHSLIGSDRSSSICWQVV